MKTHYLTTLLGSALLITMSSCRSESLHTTEAVQATMSNIESDRVYYIERTADKFAADLVLHLSLGEEILPQTHLVSSRYQSNAFEDQLEISRSKIAQNNHNSTIPGPSPAHIGPFQIKHARSIQKEAWDLEKLILEWIFAAEE